MAGPMDEIATIAQDYYDRHQSHALVLIDDQVSLAVGQSRWPEVLKWFRVRNRLRRLQIVHAADGPNAVRHASTPPRGAAALR